MKKRINIEVVIISIILALIASACAVYVTFNTDLDVYYKIEAVSDLIALLFAFAYILNGYSKDFNKLYKTAMIVDCLNALIVTAVASNENTKYIPIISCAICFGCILVLAISKNLGQKMSLGLCTLVIVLRAMGLASGFIEANMELTPQVILVICQMILSFIIFISTYAKYVDKKLRNTI